MNARIVARLFLGVAALTLVVAPVARATQAQTPPKAAIASAQHLATDAGFEILAQGGNAFDAAVAVAAALAVVEQSSSGLGGGAFFLVHRAADGHEVMIDAREVAPAATRAEQYLDAKGELDRNKSLNGPLAAGIPGHPAGLVYLAEHYGKLPLKQSLAPAIRLAKRGFALQDRLLMMMGFRKDVLARDAEAAKVYLRAGLPPAKGTIIKQPDLARTLEAIAARGSAGFYTGPIAKKLVDATRAAGGTWTLEDLANYQIKLREPVRFDYRGYHVVTAPPPSSGGVTLATVLNILSGYDLGAMTPTQRTHVVVEALRRAYRDRSFILGDPDFVDMPIARLIHPYYADGLRASIRLDRATPSAMLPGQDSAPGGDNTSHFSVIDREGNMVGATMSVNLPFGSCFMPAGTGVLLNNEMDDFALKAGAPNAYGLIGADANAVKPGKRMLSTMTPTFVFGADRVAILGTPGGSRIATMVLQALLHFVDGKSAQEIVAAPRIHHQYLPDVISAEQGALSPELVQELSALGHTISDGERPWGNMNVVVWNKKTGEIGGGSDPRGLVGKAEAR
jgi:gamma-glutamyltranspeptidase/glutathione hydrolase